MFFCLNISSASDFSAQVLTAVDRDQMGIGDAFTLTITIKANDDFDDSQIKLPNLNGIELLNSWTDGKSSSTRMAFINGKSEYSKSVQQAYHFMMAPKKEGKLIIPVIDVPIQGKNYKTQPVQIQVDEKFRGQTQNKQNAKNRAQLVPGFDDSDPFSDEDDIFSQLLKEKEKIFQQMQRGGTAGGGFGGTRQPIVERKMDINTNEAFFVHLEADPKEVYEGQQITANWYIYVKGQIESLDRAKFPDLKGFWKEIIEEVPSLQFTTEIVNGVTYQKALIASHALFPIRAGTSVIDEFKIKARTRMPTQFGWGEAREWTKVSKRTPIKVLPLPLEGKPNNFSGAVGSFQVHISTDGNQFPADQPFSVRVRYEGTGNAKLIELPSIQWPNGLEVYDTKSDSKFFKNGTSYKEFEILLIPRKEGAVTIPAFDFSHFDPAQKKYITKSTEPIQLTITKATGVAQVRNTQNPSDQNLNTKEVVFHAQPQFEIPEASLVSKPMRWVTYIVFFMFSMIWIGVYYFKQFRLINQSPQLNAILQKKMKQIHQLQEKQNFRLVGAESVNLIYILAAHLNGQKAVNTEWTQLIETMPSQYKELFLKKLTDSFEYFQLLGFAPDVVFKNIIESKTVQTELDKLIKMVQEIETVLSKSENN